MMDNPPHSLRMSSPPTAINTSTSADSSTAASLSNPLHQLANNLNSTTHPNLFIDTTLDTSNSETSLPTPPIQPNQDSDQPSQSEPPATSENNHKRRHSFTYEPHFIHHSHVSSPPTAIPSSQPVQNHQLQNPHRPLSTTTSPFTMNESLTNTSPTPNTLSNVSSVSSSPPLIHSFSDESFNDLPLSMRFMHKPSRSQELLEKASDPTRRNSLLNSHIDDSSNGDYDNHNHDNPTTTTNDLISSSPVSQTIEYSSPMEGVSISNGTEPGYKLVRKKSGEILKPSLKSNDSSYFDLKKRSRSLPTTPTYKQVHFGGGNDVRYFKKKDKPNAISATNSPTLDEDFINQEENLKNIRKLNLSSSEHYYGDDEEYDYEDDEEVDDDGRRRRYDYDDEDEDDDEYEDSDDEFVENNVHGETKYPRYAEVFDDDDDDEGDSKDKDDHRYKYQSPPKTIDWQLKLLNFTPLSSYDVKIKSESPVFLERLFITVDKKYLLGHIAVKNLAFEKYLIVRYSLDNWCTIIEIPTIYVPDRPEILKTNNYDRFIFQIPLENLFNSFRINPSANSSTDSINNDQHNGNDIKQEKSYQLCIKYYSDRNEYWDNNGFKNYHIKLVKSTKIHPHDNHHNHNSNNKHYHHEKMGSPPPAPDFNPRIQAHNKKPKYSNSYLKRIVSDSQIELNKSPSSATNTTISSADPNATAVLATNPPDSKPTSGKDDQCNIYHQDDNSSSDVNDFEKNNFYMSSPMLSSYNNNNKSKPANGGAANINEAETKEVNESIESLPNNSNINHIQNSSTVPPNPTTAATTTTTAAQPDQKLDLTSPPFTVRDDNDSYNISPDNDEDEIVSPSLGQTQHQYLVPPPLDPQSYKELLDNYCFFNSSNPSHGDVSSTDTFHSPIFGGGHHSRRANNKNNQHLQLSNNNINHNNENNSRNTSSASSNTLESDDITIKGNVSPPLPPAEKGGAEGKTGGATTFTVSSFLGV